MSSYKVAVTDESGMRRCLGICGKMRLSKHYGDRICSSCKARNKSRVGVPGGKQIFEHPQGRRSSKGPKVE